ncbi:MAG: ABC transporter ATP-binding protein [bacterium]|nr:ABC transporter ATP-binding protein [bacterium]
MAQIELRQVEKKFGESFAVKPLDLTIQNGEFIVLLGPSGCGKTTTLRMISGLEAVTTGTILLDGRDVTWAHPSDRDIAFVFQFFALYSHMTARENIAFPLQAQRVPRAEISAKVAEVARMLRIEHILDSKPGSLSGGDQQRVALARALVRRPAAFLMDEPLGALDAEFREGMRAEIKQLHIRQEATTVYVTHDQIEAMAMGDRIVIMSKAQVQQVGTPHQVYHDPANLFVARFIGSPGMNLLNARYSDGKAILPGGSAVTVPGAYRAALDHALNDSDGAVIVGFRPEALRVNVTDGECSGVVYADDLHGGYSMLHLELADDVIIHGRMSRDTAHPIGETMVFDIDPAMMRFFHPKTELAIHINGGAA